MSEIRFQVAGVTIEAFFKSAVLFKDVQYPDVGQKCLEAFSSFGLKPREVTIKVFDQIFNYELSISLFNGNGALKISSEKLFMDFKNLVSEADVNIVSDCVVRTFSQIPLKEIATIGITVNAHATMPTVEGVQQYLRRQAKPDLGIISGGTLANVMSEPWPHPLKMTIDQSLGWPNGLFLSWTTATPGPKLTQECLSDLGKSLIASLGKFDLSIAPKEQLRV